MRLRLAITSVLIAACGTTGRPVAHAPRVDDAAPVTLDEAIQAVFAAADKASFIRADPADLAGYQANLAYATGCLALLEPTLTSYPALRRERNPRAGQTGDEILARCQAGKAAATAGLDQAAGRDLAGLRAEVQAAIASEWTALRQATARGDERLRGHGRFALLEASLAYQTAAQHGTSLGDRLDLAAKRAPSLDQERFAVDDRSLTLAALRAEVAARRGEVTRQLALLDKRVAGLDGEWTSALARAVGGDRRKVLEICGKPSAYLGPSNPDADSLVRAASASSWTYAYGACTVEYRFKGAHLVQRSRSAACDR